MELTCHRNDLCNDAFFIYKYINLQISVRVKRLHVLYLETPSHVSDYEFSKKKLP